MQKTPGRGGKFIPTEIGLVVTDLLVENFKDIFDPQYTARLEGELDEIEDGKEKWTAALREFYDKFERDLSYAEKHMENIKRMEKPTDQTCERCGAPLVLKWGKHGSFFACSTYDKKDPNSCTFTKENPVDLPDLDSAEMGTQEEEYCENCGRPMVLKRGRFGQFMACTGYPDCKTTRRLDQAQENSGRSVGREVSAVPAQSGFAPRAIRRIRRLLGLSRMQMGKAELHRDEMSGVQGRRAGREESATRQFLLRLFQLPQVPFHIGHQAGSGKLPEMRRFISGGEDDEGRHIPGLS